MRDSCLNCARKHCSAALILEMEVKQGYPIHAWLVVGHLNEAADELITDYPALADRIRQERLNYMDSINECLKFENDEFYIDGDIYNLPLIDIISDITIQNLENQANLEE
jgi:hypothetical protein